MTWQITWSLILGFTLSAIVQAVVRRQTVVAMLGDDRPATLARATGLGAASSSCSYAAVALARSLFRQGASFTAAMVFEIASTNLVVELGIILALLIGWQFTLAEFVGGPIMIVGVEVAFLIGPVISVLSFVCSIGNVPLAAVLWNGGISFGGVVSFIFADLIIIPILFIYRKYYGTRMTLVLLGIFYATMVIAGYIVEFSFGALGLIPATRAAKVGETSLQWNYTTYLNIVFLLLAAALLIRFFRTGGGPMLKVMGGGPAEPGQHGHGHHDHGGRALPAGGR